MIFSLSSSDWSISPCLFSWSSRNWLLNLTIDIPNLIVSSENADEHCDWIVVFNDTHFYNDVFSEYHWYVYFLIIQSCSGLRFGEGDLAGSGQDGEGR